jgi:hypothetical protein
MCAVFFFMTALARPQVADEGMASNVEGSCEYIE